MAKRRKSAGGGRTDGAELSSEQPDATRGADSAGTAVSLQPGKRAVLVGCARAACSRGEAWIHGHRLEAGAECAVLRSLPDVGSSVVLEGGPCGADVLLTQQGDGASPARFRVVPYADAVAAGHATLVPQEWRDACDELAACAAAGARVCVVVCGPKNAGKSTLMRLLVNTLQSTTRRPVGLLDADCGAPETTPPGMLSLSLLRAPLLGPPAARLGAPDAPRPLQCRFVGDTSPASDPGAYASAAAALLDAWRAREGCAAAQQLPTPLVVNTLGWVRGLGLELLAGLLRGSEPTHVLHVRPPGVAAGERGSGVPRGVLWGTHANEGSAEPPCRVVELAAPMRGDAGGEADDAGEPADAAAAQDTQLAPSRRSAADARALLWGAWAHAAAHAVPDAGAADAPWAALLSPEGPGETAAFATVAAALAAVRPLAVPFAALRCVALHAAVAPCDVLLLLNGALVALLAPEAEAADHAAAHTAPRCLGLALVRSVDATAGVLYLLTPLPPEEAATATALAVGRLELPVALLASPQHAAPYLTAWALASDGSGGAMMRSRNNLQRGALEASSRRTRLQAHCCF